MGHWNHWRHNIIFFSLIFAACFCYRNACRIEGSTLEVTMGGWINDTYRGIFWEKLTTGVESIYSYRVGGVTDNRAYLSTDLVDSRFQLFTTALFEEYEEYEVSHSMIVSVTYRCTGGTINFVPQTIMVNVIDTNNNPPTFILPPSGEFVFTIAAPMPPGYEITSCLDLTVRDIDLTTEKIIFEIEENPYFEIQKEIYRNPSTPKEFKAILRTKTFIRSFPGEIKLTIKATDYDLTGDPPRTKETTVRFLGNTDFVLPEEPVFSETFYLADYTDDNRVVLTEPITLQSGYDKLVQFNIRGVGSENFELVEDQENKRSIRVVKQLAGDDLGETNIHLIVTAHRELTSGASSTVVLRFPEAPKDSQTGDDVSFGRVLYGGVVDLDQIRHEAITITGYDGTTVEIIGQYSSMFESSVSGGGVTVQATGSLTLPADITHVALELHAARGRTVLLLNVLKPDSQTGDDVSFGRVLYGGVVDLDQIRHEPITITGYDGTTVEIIGQYSSMFESSVSGGGVTVQATGSLTLPADITHVTLELHAARARTVLLLNVLKPDSQTGDDVSFGRVLYGGVVDLDQIRHEPITITGYDGTTVEIIGQYSSMFESSVSGGGVTVQTTGSLTLPADITHVALELHAARARTVLLLNVLEPDSQTGDDVSFGRVLYGGVVDLDQIRHEPITITGYDGTTVEIIGQYSSMFKSSVSGGGVTVQATGSLTLPADITHVALELHAARARTVLLLNVLKPDSQTGDDVSFGRVLYGGVVDLDQIRHEPITITGYDGTTVEIIGQYSSMFESSVSGGGVTVQTTGSLTLPADITHVALELHAARARTVLLLNVLEPDVPLEPSVTFSSESYLLHVDTVQIGLVGRVSATANNGEEVTFSLGTDDAHLQTRLSINNEGEMYLSTPANSGVYTFQVIATTVITKVTGTASVYLSVQSVTVCEDKGIVMPPLIILERDEESAHSNLVVLDSTQQAGCHFTLSNRWPTETNPWLYVDEFGLHTNAIDREHASIAFMALSQVQVELILHCRSDTDSAIREKRSETTARLGPYEYGSNKWILTDTIPFNSKRSLVNLIVNDINDNDPIFVGKEHEPIVVGYPTDELEERILPRSLAELKANDADIGVNAALRYWSSESALAVAPTTGFVHVRTGARLTHDQTLTVTATDENGQGRSGTIQLMVKLLDLNHIAVVTIKDAFLDDETTVLAKLGDAVGYEVKALRSVVISDDIDGDVTRKKREAGTPRASLQLYVYGINEREPVTVDRLAADIRANSTIAGVVSTIPLEYHLQEIIILYPQIGLLVATIILSVLLFAVIVIVSIWFFLRWRKNKNYDEFNDENSLTSRNASLGELPKPEAEKPRLNFEDLKRSEKRLQEMLQAPIKTVTVEKKTKKREAPVEAILDLPIIEPRAPIVFQPIDKLKDAEESSEDEFGEASAKPRKSVVTFNETVERSST